MKKKLNVFCLTLSIMFIIISMQACSVGKLDGQSGANQSRTESNSSIASDGNTSTTTSTTSSNNTSSDESSMSSLDSENPSQQVSSEGVSSNKPVISKPPTVTKPTSSKPTSKPSKPTETGFSWDRGGNYTGAININLATSPKLSVLGDGSTMIDISNSSDGYIVVSHSGSSKRLKFQVIKDGRTYNYDLNNSGYEEVFPLQMGDGSYKIRVMENVSGSSYVQLFTETISVSLSSGFSPFLHPSQYVNYDSSSRAVKKSFDLTMNGKTDIEKVRSAYNYIITNVKYDKVKAQNVQTGYIPNVDETLATNKGICFDYAVLLATMLRAQNIPTRLVVGEVAPNAISHAWNEVYIKNQGWVTVGLSAKGGQWERLDSTFSASNQQQISSFIGNGSNYTALRIY